MKLTKNETVLTAFAEYCCGPGWSNQILTVVIRDEDKKVRVEYLQPEEWQKSVELSALFPVSSATNGSIVNALNNLFGK